MVMSAYRIGAIFYVLWGLAHIIAGALMLDVLSSEGGTAALGMLGNAVPPDQLPQDLSGVASSAFGLLFWDLVWFGMLVSIVAVTLVWKNNQIGFWICLGVVLSTDIAYMYAIAFPGYIAFPRGFIAPPLAVLAIVFSTVGYLNRKNSTPCVNINQ